jgi:4-hydroxy-3-methylbut-2-enyl diphosphate reductase
VLTDLGFGNTSDIMKAMEMALEAARGGLRPLYTLGPLIHNRQTVDRLAETGLTVVDSPAELGDGPVLIRAHGLDPATAAQVAERSADVVDATCVLVRHAQQVVKTLHEEGYRVVVIGDADHPEVQGIVGYAPNVVVVGEVEDIDNLPRGGRLGVVGQTTLPQGTFAEMIGHIAARPFREIKVVNTLCREVDRRLEAARALCCHVDVMFVLGGLHSANTRRLAQVCREEGVPTYHLEDWSCFRSEYVAGCRVAGVTAGASTPDWIIEGFVENLARLDSAARSEGT